MRRIWPLTLRGTGALVLALACFVAANELGVVELVYFGVLLLAVLAAAFASLYFIRRTETVTRMLTPDVPAVGGDATVTVRVDMRTALPTAPGSWRDTLPKGVAGAAKGSFPAIGSGLRGGDRAVEVNYSLEAVRRGIHWIGPLQVTSTDPFGIARRSGLLGERTRVVVAPAIVDLPSLAEYAGDTGGTLHTTTSQLGQGADNLIARPYASGDSMRRIHWRASAHRDELMVRQEEQESTPEATVVFDLGTARWSPASAEAPGRDARFEAGLSACVSAVARLVHDGYTVLLLDAEGMPLWDPIEGGDAASVEAMNTQFATLTARRGDALAHVADLFSGGQTGPVVLIVGRLEAADAAALAAIPHHSALPVLMAVSPTAGAVEAAAASGWHAVGLGPDVDLAAAWASTGERGLSRASY
jgi:uncharacterized protein (DUF58 family)